MGYEIEDTRNEAVAVSDTSVIIAEARLNRIGIKIKNTSSDPSMIITVNYGNYAAVANAGSVLDVREFDSDWNSENYICYQGIITAVCAVAGGQLSIYER